MLATARNPKRQASSRRRNDKFLQLLPAIREQAEYAFRGLPVDAREELIQEVVAQAYALFVRLARGANWLSSLPTPLAQIRDQEGPRRPATRLAEQQPGHHVTACPRGEGIHDRAPRPVQSAEWPVARSSGRGPDSRSGGNRRAIESMCGLAAFIVAT